MSRAKHVSRIGGGGGGRGMHIGFGRKCKRKETAKNN
jgi:hypothetical protein